MKEAQTKPKQNLFKSVLGLMSGKKKAEKAPSLVNQLLTKSA
jgi:hypothetical protein